VEVFMRHFAIILVALTTIASAPALAKGGYVRRSEPVDVTTGTIAQSPSIDALAGCGHGRYRDPVTHQCRGPADVGG
jgi:hypothetical protein